MSHFSHLKTIIKDKKILEDTLKDLGYNIRCNSSINGFAGATTNVELAISMPKGYDIGFVRNDTGAFDIVADFWGVDNQAQNKLNEDLKTVENRIKRDYSIKKVLKETSKQGFEVVEKEEKDGTMRITVRRWI